MAGITGIWQQRGSTLSLKEAHEKMTGTLFAADEARQGPSQWLGEDVGVAFGAGCGSDAWVYEGKAGEKEAFSLCFAGHIFNMAGIRRDLMGEGVSREGLNDEKGVIAAAMTSWGIHKAVRRFDGTFVFAFWDARTRRLFLGRDRFGAKSLFYAWVGQTLIWGSSQRALAAYPGFKAVLRERAATLLQIRHGCLPAPYGNLQGSCKVEPGAVVAIDPPQEADAPKKEEKGRYLSNPLPAPRGGEITFEGGVANGAYYWSAPLEVIEAMERAGVLEPRALVEEFSARLEAAVRARLEACMARENKARHVAVLWSGHPSQALLAGAMAASRPEGAACQLWRVHCEDGPQDGMLPQVAQRMAGQAGIEYQEHGVTAGALLDLLPRLPQIWEEPVFDVELLQPLLLGGRFRKGEALLLSHCGADVLYGEKAWRRKMTRAWRKSFLFPFSLWRMMQTNKEFYRCFRENEEGRFRLEGLMHGAGGSEYGMRNLLSNLASNMDCRGGAELARTILSYDLLGPLPEGELAPLEQGCRAVGLEALYPFLDHRVVDLALVHHPEQSYTAALHKWVLHRAAQRRFQEWMPVAETSEFEKGMAELLRGDLRPWADALVGEALDSGSTVFERGAVQKLWKEYQERGGAAFREVWTVLMVQLWRRNGTTAEKAPARDTAFAI